MSKKYKVTIRKAVEVPSWQSLLDEHCAVIENVTDERELRRKYPRNTYIHIGVTYGGEEGFKVGGTSHVLLIPKRHIRHTVGGMMSAPKEALHGYAMTVADGLERCYSAMRDGEVYDVSVTDGALLEEFTAMGHKGDELATVIVNRSAFGPCKGLWEAVQSEMYSNEYEPERKGGIA